MKIDTVINGNCLEVLKTIPNESIDLIVTSPPYAEQRADSYGGISEKDFPNWMMEIGKQIYRVLRPKGSFVLNIKEYVDNGRRIFALWSKGFHRRWHI